MSETNNKSRRSAFFTPTIKALFFLLVGIILIVQPWLRAVAWVGWIIVALLALIGVAALVRLRNARSMQKQLIAEFASGDAVYQQGLRIDGALYDFSTFGAQIDAVTFDGVSLRFSYSFYARRGGRTGEIVTIPVEENEAEKAQTVLQTLNLPTVEAFLEKNENNKPSDE